jgi:hypothetical protein
MVSEGVSRVSTVDCLQKRLPRQLVQSHDLNISQCSLSFLRVAGRGFSAELSLIYPHFDQILLKNIIKSPEWIQSGGQRGDATWPDVAATF